MVPWTLTRNLTWTPPNQVSYLKGSSMESFSLGLLHKLDFTAWSNHIETTLRELAHITITDLKFSGQHLNLDRGRLDGKQQPNSITGFTCFLIKLQSPRSNGVALASGWLQAVFTKHVLSCSEFPWTQNSVRTVAYCLHRHVYWAVQNLPSRTLRSIWTFQWVVQTIKL